MGGEHKRTDARRRYEAIYRRNRIARIRDEIVDLLGSTCVKCGFDDRRALAIDHINGGGLGERQKWGGSYYPNVLKLLQSGSTAYQLLCFNCNEIKKRENEENRARVHDD